MSDDLFHGFFDDAAIFPPGLAPLDVAVRDHIRRSQNPVADEFIGPLILPMEKVDEAALLANGHDIEFSVIAAASDLHKLTELIQHMAINVPYATVVALEAKVSERTAADIAAVSEFAARNPSIGVFVELPYQAVTDEHLKSLADGGLALKFRTGGIKQELFPTPEQVIEVIGRAQKHGLRFKLTAGLHRAMRYVNPATGFQHFGFLNIAAATAALQRGADADQALQLLNSDDSMLVSKAVVSEPVWRESFSSFGTCSVSEPAETLTELGLLGQDTTIQFQ